MSSMIKVAPNDTYIIPYQSPFRDTALFPQAKIYDSADNLKATKNLSHVGNGYYSVTHQLQDQGKYVAVVTPYSNAGHTTVLENEGTDIDYITVEFEGQSGALRLGSVSKELAKFKPEDIARMVWEYKLREAKGEATAAKELLKKSEFNPLKERVIATVPELEEMIQTQLQSNTNDLSEVVARDNKRLINSIIKETKAIREIKSESAKDISDPLEKIFDMLEILGQTKGVDPEVFGDFSKNIFKTISMAHDKSVAGQQALAKILKSDSSRITKALVITGDMIRKQEKKVDTSVQELQKLLGENEKMLEMLNIQDARRFQAFLAQLKVILEKLGNNQKILQSDMAQLILQKQIME